MPANPKAKVTRLRIAVILFALAGGAAVVAAFGNPTPARIGQAVVWFSLSIAFLANARNKSNPIQS